MTRSDDLVEDDCAVEEESPPSSRGNRNGHEDLDYQVGPLWSSVEQMPPSFPSRSATVDDAVRELRAINVELRAINVELRAINLRLSELGARQLDLESDVNRKLMVIMELLKEALGRT